MSRTLRGARPAGPRWPSFSTILSGGALAAILVASAGLTVSSSWAAYEEYVVNDDTEGQESRRDPVAARLDNGDTLVLWEDNGRGHTDILARVFSPDGEPRGDAFRVNEDDGFHRQQLVQVTESAAGVIHVVWEDGRQGSQRIYTRRFDASTGATLGGDQWVDVEFNIGDGFDPKVAVDPEGTALVAWTAPVMGTDRIAIQFFDASGNRVGTNLAPIPDGESRDDQELPYVASLPSGNWMLSWTESDNGNDLNVYYTVLDENGSAVEPVRRANGDIFSAARQSESSLFVRENDVLIAWNDDRNSTGDLRGRWLDHTGEPEDADFLLREIVDSGPEQRPRLVAGLDGTFALTWFGGSETRQRAFIKFFNADRSDLTASLTMDDPAFGILQRQGVLLPRSDGDWDLWWSDDRTLTYDIYTRAFDLDTEEGTPVSAIWSVDRSSSQIYPDVALFPNGGAVVAWADLQYGALSIIARELDATGEPSGASVLVNDVPPGARLSAIDDLSQIPDFTPSVAASEAGFVVTWAINEEGGRLNVYGQLYDRAFSRVGGNFLIAEGLQNTPQWDARPVMYPDGSFAVAYRMAAVASDGDIYVQRYQAGGATDGDRRAVVDETFLNAGQASPEAALSPFNEMMVTWVDDRSGSRDIYAQRLDPNLNPIGSNLAQHAGDLPSDDQTNPACAISGDRTVTVWDDRAISTGEVSGRLEIFPSLRSDGTSTAREVVNFQANPGRENRGAKFPQVAVAPSGQFVVMWWDNVDGESRLHAQRFDQTGQADGDPYDIHGSGLQGARLFARAQATNEFIQYIWTDSRRGRGWDIRSRRVDWGFNGAPSPVGIAGWETRLEGGALHLSWRTSVERDFAGFHVWRQLAGETPSTSPVLDGDAVRLTPELLAPTSDARYSWTDATLSGPGTYEYLLQAIDTDGSQEFHGPFRVDWIGGAVAASTPVSLSAWPLPFRSQLNLRVDQAGIHQLEIVDASGRRIRRLGVVSDGVTPVTWDGKDARGRRVPSGVYFVRPVSSRGEPLRVLRIE